MYSSKIASRVPGPKTVLAQADSLVAVQAAGVVTVRVAGKMPVGHEVRFQVEPAAVFPAEYRLILFSGTRLDSNEIIEFQVEKRFPAQEPISRVFVTDGRGRHEVKVKREPVK